MSADNEWITVTKASKKRIFRNYSRGGSRRGGGANTPPLTTPKKEKELSIDEITDCIQQILDEIPKSMFLENLKSNLLVDTTTLLPPATTASMASGCNSSSITLIVCYGIGNFGTQSASQWQLACAISLWRMIIQEQIQKQQQQQQQSAATVSSTTSTTENRTNEGDNNNIKTPTTPTTESIISMEYYDPCMTQNEIIYLERIGVNVLSVNQRGQKRIEDNNECTLFFMPHCPLSLYTNVIHTNWECLDRVIIFGNSMSTYAHRLVNQNKHTRLLQLLEPSWIEIALSIETSDIVQRSGNFEQAFNDSSITYFKIDKTDTTTFPERPSFFKIITDSDEEDEVI